ncbi:MAG TPA: hypothetical protein VN112_24530 [Ensifer sp.]|nr:hypothetical protein [Ensifer sp.]
MDLSVNIMQPKMQLRMPAWVSFKEGRFLPEPYDLNPVCASHGDRAMLNLCPCIRNDICRATLFDVPGVAIPFEFLWAGGPRCIISRVLRRASAAA